MVMKELETYLLKLRTDLCVDMELNTGDEEMYNEGQLAMLDLILEKVEAENM